MSNVVELFGKATDKAGVDWQQVIKKQICVFTNKRCYKVRKSDPNIAIGTCTVLYGKQSEPVIICPDRLIERGQVFTDCFHLLTTHEPGNELHIVPEVSIPGGSVDYFLVSARADKVKDFVGIELQTLDTTGTVWPERQRLLKELGIPRADDAETSIKSYGMNWKMTAKTVLMQMYHKIHTFEHIHKKLVLVIQDKLLTYMTKEFKFDHLNSPVMLGDSMHLHTYSIERTGMGDFRFSMALRLSTDADGIGTCLGLQARAHIDLEQIITALQSRISTETLFTPV